MLSNSFKGSEMGMDEEFKGNNMLCKSSII